ncbi:MAG: HD domain-containing protein [Gemmatimonadetes bacterium]|nr:HD domain-containing protein [Gemmatimonadota bacterium]
MTAQPSLEAGATGESQVRQAGRDFLLTFYATLRNLKIYPIENEQVQKSLDELSNGAAALHTANPELEIKLVGELIFINGTRLRVDLNNYASFSYVLNMFRQADIGVMFVDEQVQRKEWQVFASLVLASATDPPSDDKLHDLQQRMKQGGVNHILVEPPPDELEMPDEVEQKERAKRTYERSLTATRDVANGARMGKTVSVKKVKRAVQDIVDQVLNNEVTLVGLTTLRDYDDYTFTHSVNVCIFSVSVGKRLGLTKLQLYDLGMGAFLHDMGKARVPIEILGKVGKLTPEEWAAIQLHPALGAAALFGFRGYGDVPFRPMICAYEHHIKIPDLSGYPKSIRPRQLSVYSNLIHVCDVFDAATSQRVYTHRPPLTPDQILQELWNDHDRLGVDPVCVKALINLLGVYPVGTCVVLDMYEVAVVHGANPDAAQIHRPMIRLIFNSDGARTDGELIDLTDTNPDGSYKRTIIKVVDPAKYGITVSDYFV